MRNAALWANWNLKAVQINRGRRGLSRPTGKHGEPTSMLLQVLGTGTVSGLTHSGSEERGADPTDGTEGCFGEQLGTWQVWKGKAGIYISFKFPTCTADINQ